MYTTYELRTDYDHCISFHGKAHILETDEEAALYSYGSLVALVNKITDALHIVDTYSRTTTRHIREFAYQWGYGVLTSAEIQRIISAGKSGMTVSELTDLREHKRATRAMIAAQTSGITA